MFVLTSPNERDNMKLALGGLYVPDNLPFDFKLITNRGIVAVERKKFPFDLFASLRDGRLARECAAMREAADFRFIILEGKMHINRETGYIRLSKHKDTRFTRRGFRNLLRSIRYVEGCDIEWSSNTAGTVDILTEIQSYFDEENHFAIRVLPKLETDFYSPTYEEQLVGWLQRCGTDVGIIRARELAKVFHTPTDLFCADVNDISSIKGIGKKTAAKIYDFLHLKTEYQLEDTLRGEIT